MDKWQEKAERGPLKRPRPRAYGQSAALPNDRGASGFVGLLPFAAALSLAAACVCLFTSSARAAGWQVVFSDDFGGTSLDRNKWATRYIYNNETLDHFNDESERYRDDRNHIVANGVLDLVARKDTGDRFTSGMIRSYHTFYYGYFEARVFLPSARGVWPAFWLVGDYDRDGVVQYPPEIDIFEYALNGREDTDNMLHSAVKDLDGAAPPNFTFVDPQFSLRHNELIANTALNTGWHTAGYVWAPDRVSFFWDGRHIFTRDYRWLNKGGTLGPPAHVILNFAVGGGWAGRHGVDASAFPQSFRIDYVRVCQYTASEAGARQCGDSAVTPDPQEFGYHAPFDDLPKPTLLPVVLSDGLLPGAEVTSSVSRDLRLRVPFDLPPDYPQNRALKVDVFNDATGQLVLSAVKSLAEASTGTDSHRFLEFDLAPLARAGKFSAKAQLLILASHTAAGTEYERSVPITCKTGIIQSIKARACSLGSVVVKTP